MSLKVDRTTKSQAMEYADNEADVNGFGRGSEQWQSALQEYIKFAIGTMSVGRNPREFKYKVFTSFYRDLGSEGFAGRVAKEYIGPSGKRGEYKLTDIQNRILAAVASLSKLYENGVLGIRTTTVGSEEGSIANDKISGLQFPNKTTFTGDNYTAEVNRVVQNWVTRDIISTIILELLTPLFQMTEDDFRAIAKAINLEGATLANIKVDRPNYISAIQKVIKSKMADVNIRRLLLG